jgi:hypothetical protein
VSICGAELAARGDAHLLAYIAAILVTELAAIRAAFLPAVVATVCVPEFAAFLGPNAEPQWSAYRLSFVSTVDTAICGPERAAIIEAFLSAIGSTSCTAYVAAYF